MPKKIFILILCFLCLNAYAQTPPGFKGQVYSDIQDNGYEWANVDGKQHTIAPKEYFCMAEMKEAALAPKYVTTHMTYDMYERVGFLASMADNYNEKAESGRAYAIWVNNGHIDDQTDNTLGFPGSLSQFPNYEHSTYYLACVQNISPKSNMYITASQSDLINKGKN